MSTTTPLPLAAKSALVTGVARSIGAEIALTADPEWKWELPAGRDWRTRS